MGSLFKKRGNSQFGDGVLPYFPDPRTAPPEYFNLFQLAGTDQLATLKKALKKLPEGAVQVRLGPQSLLHCAAQNGAHEVVKFLLAEGLDKNLPTSGTGVTPLLYALQARHSQIAETLLKAGADPNQAISAADPRFPGLTPLHFAVGSGELQLIQLLIASGANPQQGDVDGQTPLDLARRLKNDQLVALLKQGAEATVDDSDPEALARLASDQSSVKAAGEYISRIEALSAQHPQEKIGGCVAMVAINLCSRVQSRAEADQCFELLRRSGMADHPGIQANFSNALRHAATHARPAEAGYEIAQLMKQQPQFENDLDFREAYANTLFNISVVATSGAYCNSLAQEIATLPGFAESPTMHFNCGRILSNAAGLAQTGPEARSYAEVIAKLPLYPGMPQLHEASERALRNCARFEGS